MDNVNSNTSTASDSDKPSTANSKLLFTAFEPSGDSLAAAVIAKLKKTNPKLEIYALGGEKMQAAGAVLIENSCAKPVMLAGAIKQIFTHKARVKRLGKWIKKNEPTLVIPVDSPAANWAICKLSRRYVKQSKIVHLAAPQIWAWARWRISKLRKLTDKVLCLLPFEAQWFESKNIKAKFVGHPIFTAHNKKYDQPIDIDSQYKQLLLDFAMLPGSRKAEIKANWPAMFKVAKSLHTNAVAKRVRVFSANKKTTAQIVSLCPDKKLPDWMELIQTDVSSLSTALYGFDIALCVSGTVTLECVAQGIPLVCFYKVNWLSWNLAGRWLVKTRTFTLPNLVTVGRNLESETGREQSVDKQLSSKNSKLVPELVPWFGDTEKLTQAVTSLVKDKDARQKQRQAFNEINKVYEQKDFVETAAKEITDLL